MADFTISPKKQGYIRIGAFGYRGVGKSTYLTAFYYMLLKDKYKDVTFEYDDDDSANTLSRYLKTVNKFLDEDKEWQLPPTQGTPKEINVKLNIKNKKVLLNLIDYRGEATELKDMVQDKELLEYFKSCDGIMLFYSASDSEKSKDVSKTTYNDERLQDFRLLLDRINQHLGKDKISLPIALINTKSDDIKDPTFASPEINKWVDSNLGAFTKVLKQKVEKSKIVFLSSKKAFSAVRKNPNFEISTIQRSDDIVDSDTDIAYPLFWIIDEVTKPKYFFGGGGNEPTPTKKKWWKFFIIPIIFGVFFLIFRNSNEIGYSKHGGVNYRNSPESEIAGKFNTSEKVEILDSLEVSTNILKEEWIVKDEQLNHDIKLFANQKIELVDKFNDAGREAVKISYSRKNGLGTTLQWADEYYSKVETGKLWWLKVKRKNGDVVFVLSTLIIDREK